MKRKRIYTYGGRPAQRNLTVAELIALKGNTRLCQTCPATEEEAAACSEVGIDVLNTSDADLPAVRAGAPETFTIADLPSVRQRLADERQRALGEYRSAVMNGSYPDAETSVSMLPNEHDKLLEALDAHPLFHS